MKAHLPDGRPWFTCTACEANRGHTFSCPATAENQPCWKCADGGGTMKHYVFPCNSLVFGRIRKPIGS